MSKNFLKLVSDRSTGALPPPGKEWTMGLTVAQIRAIHKEAEQTGKSPEETSKQDKFKG